MIIKYYSVDAGTIETMTTSNGYLASVRNYKYSNTFATIEEALRAYNMCITYPFCEITMTVEINGKQYDIELNIAENLVQATNSGEI